MSPSATRSSGSTSKKSAKPRPAPPKKKAATTANKVATARNPKPGKTVKQAPQPKPGRPKSTERAAKETAPKRTPARATAAVPPKTKIEMSAENKNRTVEPQGVSTPGEKGRKRAKEVVPTAQAEPPKAPIEVAAKPLPPPVDVKDEKPTKRTRAPKAAKSDSQIAPSAPPEPIPPVTAKAESPARPERGRKKTASTAKPGKSESAAESSDDDDGPLFGEGVLTSPAAHDEDAAAESEDEFFEPKRGRAGRGTRSPRGFDADNDFLEELEDDLPLDEEDTINPDVIDIDPLDVPLELLDPELVEVPRPALPPKPKPRQPRGERRQQKCEGCSQLFAWLSVDRLCFNCLKKKLAQRKSADENFSSGGFGGGGGGEADDDGDDT